MKPQYMIFGNTTPPSMDELKKTIADGWVWCQGWSPREGVFGRPMRYLADNGESAAACQHSASGCKNVTVAPLTDRQIAAIAAERMPVIAANCARTLAREQARNDALRAAYELAATKGFGNDWDSETVFLDDGCSGHVFQFGPLEITCRPTGEPVCRDLRDIPIKQYMHGVTKSGMILAERNLCRNDHWKDPIIGYVIKYSIASAGKTFYRAVASRVPDTDVETEEQAIAVLNSARAS